MPASHRTLRKSSTGRREDERTQQARARDLDDPEIRAGYDEARRAIEFGAMVQELRQGAGLSPDLSEASGRAAGFMAAIGLGTLRCWGRWVVLSRVWLPLTGKAPWSVITFLDDAHHRGVLRQAGAVYQFRHARIPNPAGREIRAAPAYRPGRQTGLSVTALSLVRAGSSL